MKLFKHFTSAILSMSIIAGTATTGLSIKMDSTAASTKVMYNTVISEWESRISAEKSKFPNGKYWNHKGKTSYNDETYSNRPCDHLTETPKNKLECSKTMVENGINWGQCYGFAYKLAKDIWGTTEFNTRNVDQSYEPKIGDNVRLEFPVETSSGTKYQEHSIFITGISGDRITFAECNGELEDCKIRWDRTEYYEKIIATDFWVQNAAGKTVSATLYEGDTDSLTAVTKDYLRNHATFYTRPAIAGDLNKNNKLDNDDASIFANTVMKNGSTVESLSYYDVNGDGHVDTKDYNEIRYGSNNERIIVPGENPTCRWKTLRHTNGFLAYDGSYYVPNDIGGVSWIGSVDTELSSLTIPSSVYCQRDNCWYDVNEIGYDSRVETSYGFAGWRTCTDNYKIKTLTIPDSIKKIHSYAFENWTITSLRFAGSNSQLETIGQYAFYNCKSLKTLDLSDANKLKTIDDNAFVGCTELYHIDLPYTTHSLNLGTTSNGSIFGANMTDSVTLDLNNRPSNITTYQKLNIRNQDKTYWENNNIYIYGKYFKLYNQNKYLGQVDRYVDYLRPEQ